MKASWFGRAKRINTFAYHLRGKPRCACCGCALPPYHATGKNGRISYYQCVRYGRERTACLVKQINVEALHRAVLEQIARAANHPTRMARLIAAAIAQLLTAENCKTEVSALTKKLTDVGNQINRLQEALEMGTGSVAPLVARLEELRAERVQAQADLHQVSTAIEAAKVEHPKVNEVCYHLKRILELFAVAGEANRTTIFQGLVNTIEMHT